MKSLLRLCAVTAILLCAACGNPDAPGGVEPVTPVAATVPNLSGYWMISFDPIPPQREPTSEEQDFLTGLAPGAVLLGDSGLPEFAPGDYGGLTLVPAAVDAARNYDPEQIRTVANTCKPPGLVYSMQGPFGVEIFQGTELIVIKMEYYDAVRVVFMDEDSHPADWPLSSMGHSIGHWELDAAGNAQTLVVDTAMLRPSTLFNNGVDHGPNLQMHERFRLSADGSVLFVTQEFEDPDTFEGRAARLLPLVKDDDHVLPYDCDPSYGIDIQNRVMPQ
jgi:hypothetical protein